MVPVDPKTRTSQSGSAPAAAAKKKKEAEEKTKQDRDDQRTKAWRRAKNCTEDLNKTLADQWCEINLARLTPEDVLTFSQRIQRHKTPLRAFKLIMSTRGNESQDEVEGALLSDHPYDPSEKKHTTAIQQWCSLLENDKVKRNVFNAINTQLECQRTTLRQLTLNIPLHKTLVKGLINFVSKAEKLEAVNLCDSQIGDLGVELLLPALKSSNGSLKKLYLENCGITDRGAHTIAEFIKCSTARVSARVWETHLRTYRIRKDAFLNRRPPRDFDSTPLTRYGVAPPPPLGQTAGEKVKEGREAVSLELIDLSHNKITEEGLSEFVEAVRLDKGLQVLSLRSNRIRAHFEPYPGTSLDLIALCREVVSDRKSSISVIDLRGNEGPELGRITGPKVDLAKISKGGHDDKPKVSEALKKSMAKAKLLGAASIRERRRSSSAIQRIESMKPEEIQRVIEEGRLSRQLSRRQSLGGVRGRSSAASIASLRSPTFGPSVGVGESQAIETVFRELSNRFDLHDRPTTAPPAPPSHANQASEIQAEDSLRSAVAAARSDLSAVLQQVPLLENDAGALERLMVSIDRLANRVEDMEGKLRAAKKSAAGHKKKKSGSKHKAAKTQETENQAPIQAAEEEPVATF